MTQKGNIVIRMSILFFIFGFLSLEANYCIQVMSATKDGKNVIVRKAASSKYSPFDDIRVEKRGSYLVFRIGDYRNYQDAKDDLLRIHNISRDAFIRKCDFVRSSAVYIRESTKKTTITPTPSKSIEYIPDELEDEMTLSQFPILRSKKKVTTTVKHKKKKYIKKKSNNKFGIDEDLLP